MLINFGYVWELIKEYEHFLFIIMGNICINDYSWNNCW